MSLTLQLPCPDDTEWLGRAIARALPDTPVLLYLEGDLGAGKTTTARALLRELGVSGAVRSPTYTLIERYETPHGEVAHLDLYRIADPEELHYLALDELAEKARLWLVEWPQRGQGALPPADLHLRLAIDGDGRSAVLEADSETGSRWLDATAHAFPKKQGGYVAVPAR
ncbi:MAG: tRNA (adenosine(37)-N6)-threonylcarbamoyltransferase complex ATPase subunit type 1 TsaE [Lysobacteraceae bacterium]